MKQKNLWLTVGIPGSGKTYFVNNEFAELAKISRLQIVSRDAIRFRVLDETNCGDYFGQEKEVWKEYVNTIQKYLDDSETTDVVADATHLNKKSREKLLSRLNLQNVVVNFIIAHTSIKVCMSRNAARKGREKVPSDVLINMAERFMAPREDELLRYKTQQIILLNEEEATLMKKENR